MLMALPTRISQKEGSLIAFLRLIAFGGGTAGVVAAAAGAPSG
jgi:hypothetical protein